MIGFRVSEGEGGGGKFEIDFIYIYPLKNFCTFPKGVLFFAIPCYNLLLFPQNNMVAISNNDLWQFSLT